MIITPLMMYIRAGYRFPEDLKKGKPQLFLNLVGLGPGGGVGFFTGIRKELKGELHDLYYSKSVQ